MKKFAIMLGLLASTLTSNAAYLYWQVAKDDYKNITEPDAVEFINVYAYKNGTSTLIAGSDVAPMTSVQEANISVDYLGEGYSYYVELVNFSKAHSPQVVGVSTEYIAYTDMVANNYILETPLSITSATPWHGGTIAAPEPTSAMLMLLGLAGLALKRRKA